MASRMESNSLPGRIQCSELSAKLLEQQCPLMPMNPRGEIEVKGKGSMSTVWVNEGTIKQESPLSTITELTIDLTTTNSE